MLFRRREREAPSAVLVTPARNEPIERCVDECLEMLLQLQRGMRERGDHRDAEDVSMTLGCLM